MTKNVKLFVRVTEAFNKRLEAVVSVLPGDKSDVMRFALEEFVNKQLDGDVNAHPESISQIEPPLLS